MKVDYLGNLENYKEDLIKTIQESVRINSVEAEAVGNMPFGVGPYKALEHILDLGARMGFRTKNLDGYAGYIEFGQGEETLGILGHVDVVPEGEGWTRQAFGGEISHGKIYGRGAVDDKGPTIAALYGMKAIKDSGLALGKKVRMIIGANEETNWKCMDYYFKHEEAPDLAFTPDANFPVIYAEKGSMNINIDYRLEDPILLGLSAGVAANVVPEKARIELGLEDMEEASQALEAYRDQYDFSLRKLESGIELETRGASAHGSTPYLGRSALDILMKLVSELDLGQGDLRKFVDLYNERIGFSHYGEKIGCAMEDDIVGRLTFNPGLISYREGLIRLVVDIRYPVRNTSEEVLEKIGENLEGQGVDLSLAGHSMKPLYVDKDSFLVRKLMEVYRAETGEKDAEPTTIGGATYARVMKNAVAFGPMFDGMKDVAHQKDEYIEIDHLMKILRIYTRAIYELAK